MRASVIRAASNERRLHAGPKPVVDVHHGDAGRATGQHPQQGRQTPERGAIANARRNSNDRSVRQAADDAWQRPFHAGNHHNRVGAVQRGALRQDAVHRGHSGVVDTLHMRAQRVGGDRCFFGNRQVRRTGRDHGHVAVSFKWLAAGRGHHRRRLVIPRV